MKISPNTTQITNQIGEYSLYMQRPLWNKRKISVMSTEESTIDYTEVPKNSFDIISEPYMIVARTYNVMEIMNQKLHSYIVLNEDQMDTSGEHFVSSAETITIRYILTHILSLNIDQYSHLPNSLLIKMMKENSIIERFIAFFNHYIPHTYEKEHFSMFLSYILQCNPVDQNLLLDLYISDIPIIFRYIPTHVFKMLIMYTKNIVSFSPSLSITPQATHKLRKKHIRQGTYSIPISLSSLYILSQSDSFLPPPNIEVLNTTYTHSYESYYLSSLYVPNIIISLCSTQKDSIHHKRSLLSLYSIVLSYYSPKYIEVPLEEIICSIYQKDQVFLSRIQNNNISLALISFAITLEDISNIYIQPYIDEVGKDNTLVYLLLHYRIFWIILFSTSRYSYSHEAMRIMTSFISSFSTIKFFVFERLYTIACCIENHHVDRNSIALFTTHEMHEVIEYLPEDIFISIINSIASINNEKSLLLILQKQLLAAYHAR